MPDAAGSRKRRSVRRQKIRPAKINRLIKTKRKSRHRQRFRRKRILRILVQILRPELRQGGLPLYIMWIRRQRKL